MRWNNTVFIPTCLSILRSERERECMLPVTLRGYIRSMPGDYIKRLKPYLLNIIIDSENYFFSKLKGWSLNS